MFAVEGIGVVCYTHMRRLVLVLSTGLVVLALYTFQREGEPDPNLISLAVRATVYSIATPAPSIVEVTREVEVTRIVEVVRYVEITATPSPTFTATPVTLVPAVPEVAAVPLASAIEAPPQAAETNNVETNDVAPDPPSSAPGPAHDVVMESGCPAASNHQYSAIPVAGGHAAHPPAQHGDLNLALRGYVPIDGGLSLVDISGPTDGDAPQLPGVFGRAASIAQTFQARDWNWACGGAGCRGEVLSNVEVSMVGLASVPGEAVHVPTRGAEIYGGGYVALVLFADATRLTVVYTREDSVANGYAVHLEDFCVDPNLLALYQANNSAGRGNLPGLRNGEAVGVARYHQVLVGVRDRGMFTDPRSRKDWWRGY